MADRALEIVATGTNPGTCRALAEQFGGTVYGDEREGREGLPFRALATLVTESLEAADAAADVGLYLVLRRVIKAGPPAVVALFPMVRNPGLTHAEADAHWRDAHAPLALEHHAHMTSYSQLSIVHRFKGPELDGFALCGFQSEKDLRERFYTTEESVAIIAADTARFADHRRSPRRLIAVEQRFG